MADPHGDVAASVGEYAGQMPRLRRFASLPTGHPERAALREDLILAFSPVVHHVARRHAAGQRYGYDDLVQVGMIGLISAVDRWDPARSRGDFLGYLVPNVRGEILRYFRDRTWFMRVPRRLKELSVEIRHVTGPLSQQLGRAPRPSELAEHLGVDRQEIIETLDAMEGQYGGSLDAVSETGSTVADSIGALDAELDLVEYRQALRPILEGLPERERAILMLRFFGDMTQTQIAHHLGISQMHVSRLLSRTLDQVRHSLLDEQRPGDD